MAPTKLKGKWPWFIAIGTIIVIIVIAVPLGVILPKKHHSPEKANILFPLYIYPTSNTTWDPLFEELTTYPNLNFTVVVNPSSGPGNGSYPKDEYASQVERLNAYPNVRTVGYVRTGYATRNISVVLEEVATYSGWATQSASLAMGGIFFDEIPSEYSSSMAEYLSTINQAAKSASGLQSDRMVIHNPGAIPDASYKDTNTDVTVVFEQSYAQFQTLTSNLAALPSKRTNYSYMIHSVPIMTNSSLGAFVDQLSGHAEFLFLTTLSENFYESFDPNLAKLCAVMPS